MESVRTRKGADMASNNHQLVVVKMKLKLKKHWTTGETADQRFNTPYLRYTDKHNEFKKSFNNRLQRNW